MFQIILIAITAWLLSFFLPWWSVTVAALLLGALLGRKEKSAFLGGFAGIGLLWFFQGLYIHLANSGIMTSRIAEMLDVSYSSIILLITFLIGGLAGGFSSLTGYLFKKAFFRNANILPKKSSRP